MKAFNLLFICTFLFLYGCGGKSNFEITVNPDKNEALRLLNEVKGTCKIDKNGIGDGTVNSQIYDFDRWTVQIHHVVGSYYQPELFLDDNRQEVPGKFCRTYYVNDYPAPLVGSMMALGVKFEKTKKE